MRVASLRERFLRLLGRGDVESVPNDDEIVEGGYVSLLVGQIAIERLREEGIHAEGAEQPRSHPTEGALMMRILCRAGDFQQVQRAIDEATRG